MKEQLETLLRAGYEHGASDIHLTVGTAPVFRVNGDLKRYGQEPLAPADTAGMAKAIVPTHLWEDFQDKGELDFSFGIAKVSRFRINVFKQRNAVSLAIRLIPSSIPSLESLGMPAVLKSIARRPTGLVLVTGPTGSGKSTTLAAMIDYLNKETRKHIITLEDPIEYVHHHEKSIIDQREVGFDTHTFANGLRAALRQDPDVILVGEMRDLETISTAITAAETGHLVLATLHTSSAPSTIERIVDVFPPEQQPQVRTQLASVLAAVVSQRLFPAADRKGRKAAVEIMLNNSAVANLIRSEKVHQLANVMQTSKAAGMQLMADHAQQLVESGAVSREDLLPYLRERERGNA